MNDDRIPDVIGEVLGWRAWQVVGGSKTPRLQSVYGAGDLVDRLWPTNRWMLAKCPSGHTDVPQEGCGCGLYAAADLERLIQMGYATYGQGQDLVMGCVGMAGKVIRGSQAHRAERARVIRLIVPYEKVRLVERLSRAYNVPVGLGQLFTHPESWKEVA